jgi:hypothetical protein
MKHHHSSDTEMLVETNAHSSNRMMRCYAYMRIIILCGCCAAITAFAQNVSHNIDNRGVNRREQHISHPYQFNATGDTNFSFVSEWPYGASQAVDAKGNYAFIGNGKVIQVFDLSLPGSSTILSEYIAPSYVREIRIKDTLAFVLVNVGLEIISIRDKFHLREVGSIDITLPYHVVLSDSFAYLASFGTVSVIDITNPTNPFVRGQIRSGDDFYAAFAVKDGIIYGSGTDFPFLEIIDGRNPDHLIRSPSYDDNVLGISACIQDTFLIIGWYGDEIEIFSIADPLAPVKLGVGHTNTPTDIGAVSIRGNYVYAAASNEGLFIFDISDPTKPFLAGSVLPTSNPFRYTFSIAFSDKSILASSYAGCFSFRFCPPSKVSVEEYFPGGGADVIATDGHYAFALNLWGFNVVDVSNISSPRRVGTYNLPGCSEFILKEINQRLFIGLDSGLAILDVHRPAFPQLLSLIHVNQMPSSIFLDENTLYIGTFWPDLTGGVEIFDIADPSNPIHLATCPIGGSFRIAVRDNVLYYVSVDNTLISSDITDPSHPRQIAQFLGFCTGLLLNDTTLFVGIGSDLVIYGVKNAAVPRMLGYLTTPGSRSLVQMELVGNELYMSYDNLIAIDVSRYEYPEIVAAAYNTYYTGITASGQYVYVPNYSEGLFILQNSTIHTKSVPPTDYDFILYQNFPNPFNSQTNIQFSVQSAGSAHIELFNMLGQKVATIFEGIANKGLNNIVLDGTRYASGVYYYKLSFAGYSKIEKLILLR